MSDEQGTTSKVEELLTSAGSRRHFLTGAAAAAASFGLAPAAVSAAALGNRSLKGMGETTQQILTIAVSAEAPAVTALYHVHMAVNQGRLNVGGIAVPVPTLVKIVRAILRQEQDHYAFLYGAGARPLVTSFTLPAGVLASARNALTFLEQADTIFVGAYMAANREFANAGHGKLAQYTYQIGGTEAEHRVLARAALGKLPPNNLGFERNLFAHVKGAANVLGELGILKPGVPYPGAGAVDRILATSMDRDRTAGVIQNTP